MAVFNWRGWTQPEGVLRILERGVGKNGRLWIAVTYRTATDVRRLLGRGADPLHRDEMTGLSLLQQAALRGDVEILEILADAGALPDVLEDDGGRKVLFAATVKGNKAAVAFLVERGVDLAARDELGRNALMQAIAVDKSALANWLARRTEDLDATDGNGDTALHWACRGGKLGVARTLLKAGASRDSRNHDGETPLAVATDPSPKLVELFEAAGSSAAT